MTLEVTNTGSSDILFPGVAIAGETFLDIRPPVGWIPFSFCEQCGHAVAGYFGPVLPVGSSVLLSATIAAPAAPAGIFQACGFFVDDIGGFPYVFGERCIPVTVAPRGSCITSDPFVSLGGGTCVNSGWLPPGYPINTGGGPTPPPSSTSCTTPDPFVALGGGTCVNGGWLLPGYPGTTGSGAPPPSSSSCTIPDPFVSIGGGVCINGGWVPKGGR